MFKNKILILTGLLFFLFGLLFFSTYLGTLKLNFSEFIKLVFFEKEGMKYKIIINVRLGRNILAILVGINLALAGSNLQGVMQNPLADPSIIGISSGAALAAFIVIILFPDYYYLVPIASFFGAFLCSILIYSLAWKNGISPVRLILSGIAISSFLGAGINVLMTFYPDRISEALSFMLGSLSGKSWTDVKIIFPYTLFALSASLIFSKKLNLLQLGDELATGLGLNVERTRLLFLMLASLLAASAVSTAGLIGFLGLIVPHIARILIGSDYKYLSLGTILLGGITLLLSDTLARLLFAPTELPVGIIMSCLGAPFFLYLLREKKNYVKG